MKKHVQTDSEWQEEMSQKIIDEIQCELYLDMPFMKLALSALSPKVNEQLYSMATDGTYIYYNPIRLIDIFKKNGMYLNRTYQTQNYNKSERINHLINWQNNLHFLLHSHPPPLPNLHRNQNNCYRC